MAAHCVHKVVGGELRKGLGLQHCVTGSSHKVRIAGWVKLQTGRAFQSHAPSFHLPETDTRLSVLSDSLSVHISLTIYSGHLPVTVLTWSQPNLTDF